MLRCKENKDYIDELNKKIDYCLKKISEEKFQKELEDKLKNFKFNQNLKHLNIYLIGKSGSGKSTLINEILFNGEEIAKTGKGISITKEHKEYNSENIPWLNIHDNRGIEISDGFSMSDTLNTAKEKIKETINDFEKCIHIIWYTVLTPLGRFEECEGEAFARLNNFYKDHLRINSTLPVIIILTKSYNQEESEELSQIIEKQLLSKKLEKKDIHIIQVLAKDYQIKIGKNDINIEKFGLKELLTETTKISGYSIESSFLAKNIIGAEKLIEEKINKEKTNIKKEIQSVKKDIKKLKKILKDLIQIDNSEELINDIFEIVKKGIKNVNGILLNAFIEKNIIEIINELYLIKDKRYKINADIQNFQEFSRENEKDISQLIKDTYVEKYELDNIKSFIELLIDDYFESKKNLLFILIKKSDKFRLNSYENSKNEIAELFKKINNNLK